MSEFNEIITKAIKENLSSQVGDVLQEELRIGNQAGVDLKTANEVIKKLKETINIRDEKIKELVNLKIEKGQLEAKEAALGELERNLRIKELAFRNELLEEFSRKTDPSYKDFLKTIAVTDS